MSPKTQPEHPQSQASPHPFWINGFLIDLGQNPELSTLTPLSGLPIIILNLNGTGRPDLAPLQLDTAARTSTRSYSLRIAQPNR